MTPSGSTGCGVLPATLLSDSRIRISESMWDRRVTGNMPSPSNIRKHYRSVLVRPRQNEQPTDGQAITTKHLSHYVRVIHEAGCTRNHLTNGAVMLSKAKHLWSSPLVDRSRFDPRFFSRDCGIRMTVCSGSSCFVSIRG